MGFPKHERFQYGRLCRRLRRRGGGWASSKAYTAIIIHHLIYVLADLADLDEAEGEEIKIPREEEKAPEIEVPAEEKLD